MKKISFSKIKCPNIQCEFSFSFKELQNHSINIFDYIKIQKNIVKIKFVIYKLFYLIKILEDVYFLKIA